VAAQRHEADGGIIFRSFNAVIEMLATTNGSIRLADLANMLES